MLLKYEDGVVIQTTEQPFFSQEINHGQVTVKAQTISAAGASDPNLAYSWRIINTSHDPDVTLDFDSIYQDRNGIHALINVVGWGTPQSLFYTMAPHVQPLGVVLSFPGVDNGAFSLTRSSDGSYFAFDYNSVVKLRSTFSLDRTFAVRGTATAKDYFLDGVFADEEGNFVALDGFTIERFA